MDDLANKKSSTRSELLSWLTSHTRAYTQQQQQYVGHRGGLGCLVEKNTKWSASTRLFAVRLESVSAGLDAWVQGPAKRTRHGSRQISSRRWLEFFFVRKPNWTAEKSHVKQTNGPSTISASDLAQQKACFNLHKQNEDIFLRLHHNTWYEARSRTRIIMSLRNANYLFSFKFKENTCCFSLFFSVDNLKGTFWTAYKEECVRYGTYRGIPPVSTAGNTTSVSSVWHQHRYHTLRWVR